MSNIKYKLWAFLLILVVFVPFCISAEKVSVAYIDYNNFIVKRVNGTYAGYAVEYLEKISEYTNWDYEFIKMNWQEAYKAVKEGKIDFYCVARQNKDRQKDFDFSTLPLCIEKMNLYSLPERGFFYEDFTAFNNIRIGMLEKSDEIVHFTKYAKDNNFTYTLCEYPTNELVIEALKNHDVDAIAIVDYALSDSFKQIGSFGLSPAYLMSCKGSDKMLDFIHAQEFVYFDNPTYAEDLSIKYYNKNNYNLLLTREEAEFITGSDVITVALTRDLAPIEYYDEKTKKFLGVTVDILKEIEQVSGLKFNFVPRENTEVLISQFNKGEVDLIGASARNINTAKKLNITHTTPFTENAFTMVSKTATPITNFSVVAIPADYLHFSTIAHSAGYYNYLHLPSQQDCVQAVEDGRADFTFIISMCSSYLLNHVEYAGLQTVVLNDLDSKISFGVPNNPNGKKLLSVLNKCIDSLSRAKVNNIILSNIVMAKPEETLSDYFTRNGASLLIGFFVVSILSILLLVRFQKEKSQKVINANLKKHHEFLENLYKTLPCGILQFDVQKPYKIVSVNKFCATFYGYEDESSFTNKTPDFVYTPGEKNEFKENISLRLKTNAPVYYTRLITRNDASTGYIECVLDITNTENGRVFQEVFIDVTERVLNENRITKQYLDELKKKDCKNIKYTAYFDIDEQIIVDTNIQIPGIQPGITIDQFVSVLDSEFRDYQSPEQMENLKRIFNPENLFNDYQNGHYDQSFIVCRKNDNVIQWLQSNITLRHNPRNGHLMCFDYIYDVTDERLTNDVAYKIGFTDCDGFIFVSLNTNHCLEYKINGENNFSRKETVYGEDDCLTVFGKQIAEKERDNYFKSLNLSLVQDKLASLPFYQIYATLDVDTDKRCDKAIMFFVPDTTKHTIAVTITDVTQIRASEVKHAQLLSDALTQAEKADRAKSQFLSRVSHELRTPLNAIIGFIELAKEAKPEEIVSFLASSDIAAKQLLSVINDVLDMSSIESGKLKIAESNFNFKQLITSLTNIYGTQCRQKGIEFESKITTPIDDWLNGDEMRVNQILMNLLGNAIKFTSKGHIWLTITKTEVSNGKTFLRFIVSDTGCGMSDELKSRLFKPFEQESAKTAHKYGGSGLGLSIVKNLVTMMNGSITVKSELDKGSEFIIDLPFNKVENETPQVLPHTFDHIRVLAVDDLASDREYVSLVLERMGVRFSCVNSGEEALNALEKADKEQDSFNVCLIDFRMPGMDGIDVTKQIRQKYGKDVIVIIVSAYDFQQSASSATEAGANLFISKPVFQSSLFDTLMKLTDGKIANTKDTVKKWDFTGKRVLLAEDNTLNQIVVKGYLAKYNTVVDVAQNGKEAVDKFNESSPGYYDAILMDIQMPIMDGYEASQAIRKLDHPDAKKINIIAQTANAFTDDIAKVFAAGMNAHVAKPIKPELLAQELNKAFNMNNI